MEPEVKTHSGGVRGRVEDATSVFLGIPFAAPPVGEHRFTAPRPPASWDGIRDAIAYGASAPQPDRQFTLVPEPVIPGDACLNLNVFTPDPGAAGLPVLVWMHGGGFVAGCNASPWYRGHRFARDGVVVVSINYRLGVEGFLAIDGAPPNRGVLDWLAALEWVQENIAGFGGDPANVTLAGQSAGGIGTATLLAVPRARGLFRRVGLMSGAGQALTPPDGARAQQQFVADTLGVGVSLDGLAPITAAQIRESQEALVAEQDRHRGLPALLGPVVDGDLVTETVLDAVRAGRTDAIEVLLGVTSEETDATLMFRPDFDEERATKTLARAGLTGERAERFRAAHAGAPPWKVAGQATTDLMFRAPAARFAEARAAAGHPVFAYEYRWPSPALGGLGACHCLDIPFVFDVLDAEGVAPVLGDDPPQSIADEIHPAFTAFVRDGDAGWPVYDAATRSVLALDEANGIVDDAWALQRDLFTDDL